MNSLRSFCVDVMELEVLRNEIDRIDEEVVVLLERRCKTALQIGAIKAAADAPITDPDRETEVIENIKRWGSEEFASKHLKVIYRAILAQSRILQSNPKGSGNVK